MQQRHLLLAILTMFVFVTAHAIADEVYDTGVHRWAFKDKTLALVSGLAVENGRYYYNNYTFYIIEGPTGKEKWFSIPIMKEKDGYKYDLALTTWSGFSDSMLKNAKVVQGKATYLIVADKSKNNLYQNERAPANLYVYRLTEGDEENDQWPYFFALIENKVIPAAQADSVDDIIAKEAKKLQAH